MPDPFEALRTAPTPIDPDPAFAARLRARVLRALHPDQGDQTMTLQTPEVTDRLRQGDMSYVALWVPDAERAASFYASVLGWNVGAYREIQGQSVTLGITPLKDSVGYLAQLGLQLTATLVPTAYVVFVVDKIDDALERVRAAGGHASSVIEQPYGRVAGCLDDQGMPFSLHEVPAHLPAPRTPAQRQGDVAYLTFEVVDSARARAFFGAVLGLQFSPGRVQDGWNVAEVVPMSGLSGGHQQPVIVPMYRVDDIASAVARVRAAGGQATEPAAQRYGTTADCTDDQGTRFSLGQF